jgi:hypothetical protein
MVTTAMPETRTRGNGVVGVAEPPWLHITVAPRCKTGPGIEVSR